MTERNSPYKFLEPYTEDDRTLFYGRSRETRLLVGRVVTKRVAVLFAPTGTGKTSLLRAGATAEFERRGFDVAYVRVHRNPAESVSAWLHERGVAVPGGDICADVLKWLRQCRGLAERSFVLMLDQFEEFFVYMAREGREKAEAFAASLKSLIEQSEPTVHLVFSMREEFFGRMQFFREWIPDVFLGECGFALGWLDDPTAREVITEPARAAGREFSPELVDEIIKDLWDPRGIEPASLQIVSDRLWRAAKPEERIIGLGHYKRISGDGSDLSVAPSRLSRALQILAQGGIQKNCA
jgi:hypothetical protein